MHYIMNNAQFNIYILIHIIFTQWMRQTAASSFAYLMANCLLKEKYSLLLVIMYMNIFKQF